MKTNKVNEVLKAKQELFEVQVSQELTQWGNKYGVILSEKAYTNESGCGYIFEIKSGSKSSLWNDCQIKFEFCKGGIEGAKDLIVGIIGKKLGDIEPYRATINERAFKYADYRIDPTNKYWLVWKKVPDFVTIIEKDLAVQTIVNAITELQSLVP